jgi:hypothetical protein
LALFGKNILMGTPRMEVTSRFEKCVIQEGSWSDFRNEVKKVNLELFNIIEKISPNEKYRLIKAKYAYGEKITDLGRICVPDKLGRLTNLDDPNVSPDLKEKLAYCPTPLILQLTKGAEVFVEPEDRVVPINIFKAGDLYGLYEVLVPFTGVPVVPCWSITSGGRSVFLAAQVSDAIGHKNLRLEFGVPSIPPKKPNEQWATIKTIANSKWNDTPWVSEILIFTKDWINNNHKTDISWLEFREYLLKQAWIQSRGSREQVEYSIMWETFSKAICARNLKPNPYIVDTVKHLMLLTTGTIPGFQLADDNEIMLPSKIIEKAYTDVYGLKYYAPVIMQPHLLSEKNKLNWIYYSMSYSTLLAGTPSIRKNSNIMTELREVKVLIAMLKRVLESHEERIYENLKNIALECFHSDEDRFGELLRSKDISVTDFNIARELKEKFADKTFPHYGQFFRGCFRLFKKKDHKNGQKNSWS